MAHRKNLKLKTTIGLRPWGTQLREIKNEESSLAGVDSYSVYDLRLLRKFAESHLEHHTSRGAGFIGSSDILGGNGCDSRALG
jgi:hypothetical protein